MLLILLPVPFGAGSFSGKYSIFAKHIQMKITIKTVEI